MSRLHAMTDLLRRYGAVFRHVWSERGKLDERRYTPGEAEFLPAALSLQETPVSPAPRVCMWLLIAFAALALAWSLLGRIDIVATAQGRIVPSSRSKVIQPLEHGVVRRILVEDGQAVRAGQVLIELDATAATADVERVNEDLVTYRLQEARGQAMLGALKSGHIAVAKVRGADGRRLAEATRLVEGQYAEFRARNASLDAEIAKRQAELRSIHALVAKLEQTVPIARQRAADYKEMVEANFVSRHGYLEREQQRIEQEGDLANLRSRSGEVVASLNESQMQKAALHAETRRVALDLINDAQQRLSVLAQDRIKAETHERFLRLESPVDGVVQQLAVHTVGGVVTPAQPLMVVVPQEHAMEVEAVLENKDVGFVTAGQAGEVKVAAFEYTKYGTIPSTVTHVSKDAVNDEKVGLVYTMRVKMERPSILVHGKEVNLSPGMAVTVEVKTGRRRVIEYFLSPLLRHADESLGER